MLDLFQTQASQSEPKTLYPYQRSAVEAIRSSIRMGNRRVVLMLPTGAGKTITAADMIRSARDKGSRVIFTVPMTVLIDQTVRSFEKQGITGIGVMQAQHPRTDPWAPVQIASVQTLARREVPPASFVIVDEAHIKAQVIEDLMQQRPDVVFVGLSATPWAKGMGKVWDDLIVGMTAAELIEMGVLCPFRVFAAAHPDLTGVKVVRGDFAEGELSERMSDGALVGDVVTNWLQHGEDRPTLCFAVNRAHAAKIHEAFLRAGVASAYVDAFTDRAERDHIEAEFKSGETKVICSVRTMTTGVDLEVACIIDAAPTRSEMLHVQKIGRGLRQNPPWTDCIIFDHSDNTLRLGFATDIHHDRLDSGKRDEPAPRERKEPLPVECKGCGVVLPPKTNPCPRCGHERKAAAGVEVLDGELVEVTKGAKKAAPTKADKQRFWGMALWLDRERSKGGKLALALYKARFDVWPRGLSDAPAAPDRAFLGWEHAHRIRRAKAFAKQKQQQGEARA